MNALIIYESQFGNTEQIAQAIARTLAERESVRLEPIENAGPPALEGVDLLVLGSPTQFQEATPDMLAWLDRLPPKALDGLAVAVFDTRYHMPRLLSGSAAWAVGKEIQERSGRLIAPPESFFVAERHGPLEAGEVERAAAWAGRMVAALAARAASSIEVSDLDHE
jgi:flavodoxin